MDVPSRPDVPTPAFLRDLLDHREGTLTCASRPRNPIDRFQELLTDPVFAFVDPTPLIGERIAAEIGPLVEALSQTTDVRERRPLEREIRRRADGVRESLCNPFICW
jgi:hypothetical protein